jgi:Leucine-rich repeat (LRR) protein
VVDASVFQKLTSLRVLNLANNELRMLPSDLGLHNLRRLDVSDNCLQSVEFVEQLPKLEDLRIEGNGFQVSLEILAYVFLAFIDLSLLQVDL